MVAWGPFDVRLHARRRRRDLADDIAVDDAALRALSRLPREYAACLLGHAEGLSYADLSRVFGCSVAAVKQRLYRARIAFRAAYAAESAEKVEATAHVRPGVQGV